MSEQQSPPGNESGPLTAAQVRANLAAVRAELLASLEQGQEKRLSPAEITQLRGMVDDAIQGYQDLLAAASAGERTELEHTLGRAVIDLRRTAVVDLHDVGLAAHLLEDGVEVVAVPNDPLLANAR